MKNGRNQYYYHTTSVICSTTHPLLTETGVLGRIPIICWGLMFGAGLIWGRGLDGGRVLPIGGRAIVLGGGIWPGLLVLVGGMGPLPWGGGPG